MKKILTALSLAALALTASAQTAQPAHTGMTAFATYDLDSATKNSNGFKAANEVHLGVAKSTSIGTFDGAVVGTRFTGQGHDAAAGYEVGYSNHVHLNQFTVTGRVAYGQLNGLNGGAGGPFTGNENYYSAAVEGSVPVATNLKAFAGYRFKSAFGGNMATQDRYTAGVDYKLNDRTTLRAGYAYTRQDNVVYNGLTTAVAYSF